MTQMTTTTPEAKTIDQLRSFCRGEMSAVESYTTALLDKTMEPYAATLLACQSSHRRRVKLLGEIITRLGGRVPQSSGLWGTLTEAIEGTAATFGPAGAIFALAEGEDHGLRDYHTDVSMLTPNVRSLVERDILPQQRATESAISNLRQTLER